MDRNTLLAFLLIALVLIFTPYYIETVSPPPPVLPEELEKEKSVTGSDESFFLEEKPAAERDQKIKNEETYQQSQMRIGPDQERTIDVETDLFTALVSSNGGGFLKSFMFKGFYDEDSQMVDLINGTNQENLSLAITDLDGGQLDLGGAWHYDGYFTGGKIKDEMTLVFYVDISPGKKITKSLTFYPDKYIVDIDINVADVSDRVFAGVYSLFWNGGLSPTEKNEKDDFVYFYSYVFQGGELVDLKVKGGESESKTFNGSTDWVAVRTKYFIACLLPEDPTLVSSAGIVGSHGDREYYDVSLSLPAAEPTRVSLYLGPLEYERIKGVGKELDRVMNFGWGPVKPLSRGVLWLLKKMHDYIPNYGVVLILFSILIKIIVFPLTKKSYQSTAAMQTIQPEINDLKEKHKNNPKKLNQATMKLYKDRGVNPLGGCLPMLLQMPLLFALFVVFRTTIELRGEPFVLWITDLSAPDVVFSLPFSIPIYGSHVAVLPMLMVVSMFIQQRMMGGGAAQQAQQKIMQYFMTGFFFLIFNTFPSGLNLYYTLFNVLTIAQQKLIPPAAPQS